MDGTSAHRGYGGTRIIIMANTILRKSNSLTASYHFPELHFPVITFCCHQFSIFTRARRETLKNIGLSSILLQHVFAVEESLKTRWRKPLSSHRSITHGTSYILSEIGCQVLWIHFFSVRTTSGTINVGRYDCDPSLLVDSWKSRRICWWSDHVILMKYRWLCG